jgi:hypothetical protein
MKKFLLLLALVSAASTLFAQNEEVGGCHVFRNIHSTPRPKKLTLAEQKMLQTSILRADTIDISHYEIDIDVTDYNGGTIKAATTITFSAIEPDRESIILDLFQLEVDSVTNGNGLLTYAYDQEFLQVYFDETPVVGEENQLTVYYHGEPHQDPQWGGFYFEADYIYNLGIGLSSVPPNFGKVWYPCFDIFLERATYTYHVTAANGMVPSCQGEMTEEILLDGDTIRRTFELDIPIPSYLSAIAVADYESTDYEYEGANGTHDIRLTSKPANQAGMQAKFAELNYAIDACEYWWGPMVWPRVGYVYTTDGALEIPTNIAYPQFMVNESLNSNGELMTHELGHYWWGDVVTMRVHNDMWIKEGPAEYSSFLFYEFRDGREEFIEVVKDNQLYVLESVHIQDDGFYPLSPMPDPVIYGRHTYQKGATVLHNLRGYLGDELFRQGMTAIQQNNAFSNMNPEIFRDLLNEYTGEDLTSFFDDQILKPGFSTFVIDSVNTVNNSDGSFSNTVYIQQKLRECPSFYSNVPLEITAMDQDWVKHNSMILCDGQFSVINLDTDFLPEFISLNSNGVLNQGRMDYEYIEDDTSGPINRPYVSFRLGCNSITEGDSAFVRIEHQWAAPDNDNLADYIDEISSTHYWTVDGIWPEDVEMDGRLNYDGSEPTDLDYDLVGFNENDIMLVWRPNSGHPWIKYGPYELQAGSLTNSAGMFSIEPLYKGQYAFANGDPELAVDELNLANELLVYPNPSSESTTVKWSASGAQNAQMHNLNGQLVFEGRIETNANQMEIVVSDLPSGWYYISIMGKANQVMGSTMIEVIH